MVPPEDRAPSGGGQERPAGGGKLAALVCVHRVTDCARVAGVRRQGPAQQGEDRQGAARPPRAPLRAHGDPALRPPGPPRPQPAQQGRRLAPQRRPARDRQAAAAPLPAARRQPLLRPPPAAALLDGYGHGAAVLARHGGRGVHAGRQGIGRG